MDFVILSKPLLIIVFALSLAFLVADVFVKQRVLNIVFKALCAVLFVFGLIAAILLGAGFQEIIIVNLLLLAICLFALYRRKENNNGV